MTIEQRVAQIIDCTPDRLAQLVSAETDGRASMLAMLELVKTRAPVFPDSFRFEFVLSSLVRTGWLERDYVMTILRAIEANLAWMYGGVLLAMHTQSPEADEWIARRYSQMDVSLREIVVELALRKRPELARRLGGLGGADPSACD